MTESAPNQPTPRQFFEETCDRSPQRNAPLVALELREDIEAARLFLAGYQEVIANDSSLKNLSEENRDPVLMARRTIRRVAHMKAWGIEQREPSQELIDEQLGVWKQIFDEEPTGN